MHITAIRDEIDEARAIGVASVPSLIIDGKMVAGLPAFSELREIILGAAALNGPLSADQDPISQEHLSKSTNGRLLRAPV